MLPRNIVEASVREAIDARRAEGCADASACWCPRCLADMQALALSSLPPKYVTRREDRASIAADHLRAVEARVEHAVRWVAAHPKHGAAAAPAAADGTPEAVRVVNFSYEVGFAEIEDRAIGPAGTCDCFDCRCDAIAFALNRFPARYGVSVGGRVVLTEADRREMGVDMLPFLDLGLRVVAKVPRH